MKKEKIVLTNTLVYDTITLAEDGKHGEVSEWFKELVLKTSDPARDQGFESLPLRHFILDFTVRRITQVVKRLPC